MQPRKKSKASNGAEQMEMEVNDEVSPLVTFTHTQTNTQKPNFGTSNNGTTSSFASNNEYIESDSE